MTKAIEVKHVEYRIPSICKLLDGTVIAPAPHPLAGFLTREYIVSALYAKTVNDCHSILCEIAKGAGLTEAGMGLPVLQDNQDGWLVEVTLRSAECFDAFDKESARRSEERLRATSPPVDSTPG